MTQTAHVVDGTVREILAVPAGHELADLYPAAMLAACMDVPDGVLSGWTTPDGGKTWAAPPPVQDGGSGVRLATSYALVSVLSDDEVAALGKAKAKDQHLFGKRDGAWPEDNPKIARFAAALGTTSKAWFDRVFAPAS